MHPNTKAIPACKNLAKLLVCIKYMTYQTDRKSVFKYVSGYVIYVQSMYQKKRIMQMKYIINSFGAETPFPSGAAIFLPLHLSLI